MNKTLVTTLAMIALLVYANVPASDKAPGSPLGRLFLTPEQRDALEARKKQSPDPTSSKATEKLEGFVRRSSGHSTVWIDGRMIHDQAFRQNLEGSPPRIMHKASKP